MSTHRIHLEDLPPLSTGQSFLIEGDESQHALRVKRLRPGEHVLLINGRGTAAHAIYEPSPTHHRDQLNLRILSIETTPPPAIRVEVWSSVPKGDALAQMIDQLAQVGAWSWRPLICARSVTDPASLRLDRLSRISREASKQSGRVWDLTIGAPVKASAVRAATPAPETLFLLADAKGQDCPEIRPASYENPAAVILIGPEGGFTDEEMDHFVRTDGARALWLGPHILRLETAAVVACSIVLSRARSHVG